MQRPLLKPKAVSAAFGSQISGAQKTHLCTQCVNLIQVDDVKVDIKEEPQDEANAQDDETRVHKPLNETLNLMPNVKDEPSDFQSAQTINYLRAQQLGFEVNLSECYYIRTLLVQCPACDTSYRGGRLQLPRLFEHVKKCHKRNCLKYIKRIRAQYRVKKLCDCFACIMQRGKKP